MMNKNLKKAGIVAAAALLCFGLSGCQTGSGQKAANAEEAVNTILSSIQSKDFATAIQYMEPGNELLHVFAAVDGESVPKLDEVYRTFAGQMSEMTFENLGEVKELPDTYNMKITNRDYASSIAAAMDDALRAQVEKGGDDFANFTDWLAAGVEEAPMGAADEYNMMLAHKSGGYYLQHSCVPDQIFLNLLTGGFYDYADLTMTTCTLSNAEHESVYYLAAMGDDLIASLMTDTVPYDTSSLTEEDIAQTEAMYAAGAEGMEGFWQSVRVGDGTITTSIGIDYNTADQTALMNSGIVSGAYKGNMTFTHLSLSSSIKGFEESGMTCVTVPEYDKEKK